MLPEGAACAAVEISLRYVPFRGGMLCMQETPYISGFTAGELSPWLTTRFDLQAYQRGAQRIENFWVQPYGGLQRRNGTEYVDEVMPLLGADVRLVPFVFSESEALMLLFYPGGMNVYRDGERLRKDGQTYAPSMPWITADMLNTLRVVQVNDVVYVTCAQLAPIKLMRYADDDWRWEYMDMTPYPRETYVAQAHGMQVLMEQEGRYALLKTDAGAPEFTESMVGNEYVLAESQIPSQTLFMNEKFTVIPVSLPDLSKDSVEPNAVYQVKNASTGLYDYYTCIRAYEPGSYNGSNSPADYPNYFIAGVMRLDESGLPYEVNGDWELKTHGEWNGLWELWRSYDTTDVEPDFKCWSWTRIKTFGQNEYSERQNWALSGSEDTPCRMVLVCKSSSSAQMGAYMYFRILGANREYKMRIVRFDSPRRVRAQVLTTHLGPNKSFYTRRWSFGAFGSRNGFPRFVAFYQGRLWFGGTQGLPTTLFASSVNDYENFQVDSSDDSALHLTLACDDQSSICWICASRSLLLGTTEGEWVLSSPEGQAITASNAAFTRQSSVGSEDAPAIGMENTVFFIQRGGRRLREISYKLEADGYTSTDVSLLAEHLFTSGVKEWMVQRGTTPRLWVLMNDGSFAVLTTNVEQQVTAWQRVSVPGRKGVRMASLVQPDSHDDEVWLVLQNKANGSLSVERIRDVSDAPCVDSCIKVPVYRPDVVYPGAHLQGVTCLVYPDGKIEEAVESVCDETGACSIPGAVPGESYCVGAAFDSLLQTMPLESELSFNSVRQIGRVKLRLLQSDPHFSYRADHSDRWETYDPERELFSYPYTGAIHLSHIPSPGEGQGFCLRVRTAKEFRLLSLTAEVDYHGK